MRLRTSSLLAAALAAGACGGNGGGPGGPSNTPTHSFTVVVFYDENGNGAADPPEQVKIPNATVSIAGVTARTDGTGRATLTAVPAGAQTLTVVADSLPPHFTTNAIPLTVPPTGDVPMPAQLPLGIAIVKNKYMGFGDSLTFGTYEAQLESMLRAHFGSAHVVDEGMSGTRSEGGAFRVADALAYARPAYTLILYVTNDWNEQSCKDSRFPCYTIDSLRTMIREAKFIGSLPFLATIPPVNVGFNDQAPQDREDWVRRMNEEIKKLARAEGVVLVDMHKAFTAAPSVRSLFTDYVHPSSQGITLMAQEFFKAITQRQPAS
jgi:lysophospholipase L1-like esterase